MNKFFLERVRELQEVKIAVYYVHYHTSSHYQLTYFIVIPLVMAHALHMLKALNIWLKWFDRRP